MSKHGSDFNEQFTSKEMFEMGREYERKFNSRRGALRKDIVELVAKNTWRKDVVVIVSQNLVALEEAAYEQGRKDQWEADHLQV